MVSAEFSPLPLESSLPLGETSTVPGQATTADEAASPQAGAAPGASLPLANAQGRVTHRVGAEVCSLPAGVAPPIRGRPALPPYVAVSPFGDSSDVPGGSVTAPPAFATGAAGKPVPKPARVPRGGGVPPGGRARGARSRPQLPQDSLARCRERSAGQEEPSGVTPPLPLPPSPVLPRSVLEGHTATPQQPPAQPGALSCTRCGGVGHLAEACSPLACTECGGRGHSWETCPSSLTQGTPIFVRREAPSSHPGKG